MTPGSTSLSLDQLTPGVWQTIGYNKCFRFSADRFSIYDLSAVSGILSKEGAIQDFNRVFDRLELDASGRLTFFARGGITRYTLRPLAGLPEVCKADLSSQTADPIFNFEVFWNYFQENYAFFELRQVDWDLVYRKYRPRITSQTSPAQLTEILTCILRELNDSHALLEVPGYTVTTRKPHALVRQWQKEFQSDEFLELYPRGIPRLFSALNESVLDGKGMSALNGQVLWGWVQPGIGYLCLFSLMDMYADFGLLHYAGFEVTNQAYLQALSATMDQVMTGLRGAKTLIVDVRFNPGGHDAAGQIVAGRFADRMRVAFTKQAHLSDGLTPPQEIELEPQGPLQYTRPVYLLTSEATASAAEAFVYFMMSLPHVTRVGQRTRGVLSDMLLMRLPNGWTTSISNEVYTTASGQCYEGVGIPPQVEAPVFTLEQFYDNLSLTVKNALALIK